MPFGVSMRDYLAVMACSGISLFTGAYITHMILRPQDRMKQRYREVPQKITPLK